MDRLRLGLYYHIPAYCKDGQIYLPGFFGRFVDSLAEYCQTLTCFFHLASPAEEALCDYTIKSAHVSWVNLGLPHSAPYRTLFSGRFTRLITPHLSSLDVLLLRGPSPLLPAIAEAVGKFPVVLLLVGDYLAGVDSSAQPSFRKALIRLWAGWNSRGQLRAVRHSLTLVNSHKLYEDLRPFTPHLVEVHTTTLNQADFFERLDTCQLAPVHLLYTGRLSAAKGLFDMVAALEKLVQAGDDVVLDLVGWPEKGEPEIMTQLMAFAAEKGVAGRINDLGYKSLGPDLLACYRQADIYIVASTSDFEGFPRTIWEAMANSLPVAASRVGSIPAYIEGTAELFAPSQPDDVAAALTRLIHQPELRRQYIRAGLALARENTLEVQTEKMILAIQQWMKL